MKLDAIRSKLDLRDAALITSVVNRFYFTGFTSSDGYYLITRDKAILFADSRYIEEAKRLAENCDEVLLFRSLSDSIQPVLAALGVEAVTVECDRLTVTELRELQTKLKVTVKADFALDKAIDCLRKVKSSEELDCIVKAQRIAESAFDRILKLISEGVTEREIALEIDYGMLKDGADALSFETIVVSGVNSSKPHGTPSDRAIRHGDFITMDFGAVVSGYHSDMTRTIAIGCVSDEQVKVYNTVLEAQNAAYSAIKPGALCTDVDDAARKVIGNAGYGSYFGHGLGHGVGAEIHEKPRLSPRSRDILEVGNVVSNEPGIYLPGRFGVRIEDMVLVTSDGCTCLTDCTKELLVL